MRRGWFAGWVIGLAALVVVLPLILHGCSCGHDFDFHLVSWMEAAAQFRVGTMHPAWAFSPAWNAGEPRFMFYPPMSWTLGALLGLMMPWGAVPVVYTWLALVAAGFGMYWLVRELAGDGAGAVIAAAVYMANPYMIFTAYERTAYAELLAAAWIPLLLAGILRERVTVPRVAVPVALLWLTNAPAAVMGCYALALLAAVRVVWTWVELRSDSAAARRACGALVWRVAAGVALGLGLAAFYVVPAAYERRWVQIAMVMVEGMRIGDNFLFHRTGDGPHDEVLHTASVIAVILLVAAVVVFAWLLVRSRRDGGAAGYRVVSLALLVLAIGVLLTPVSAAVWRVAPEMAFLQFPWRLTAILEAVVCAGIRMMAGRLTLNRAVASGVAFVLVAAMSYPATRTYRQECDEEDTVRARLAVFKAGTGTDPTDEYTPTEADNDVLAQGNPRMWLADDGQKVGVQMGRDRGSAPMRFGVQFYKPKVLILNLREYPAWQVWVNGVEVVQLIKRADGLIAVPLAAGSSQVELKYVMTIDREVGDAMSLVAVCVCFGLLVRRQRLGSRIIGN